MQVNNKIFVSLISTFFFRKWQNFSPSSPSHPLSQLKLWKNNVFIIELKIFELLAFLTQLTTLLISFIYLSTK